MSNSSHRLKIEERKVYRKLLATVIFFVVCMLILIFAGIPLLTKTIVFLSSFRSQDIVTGTYTNDLLHAPVLDSIAEATNSSPVVISGTADKETTVKISVNEVELAKVLSDKDGRFTAKNIKLTEGINTIVASIILQDKESSPSQPLVITFKKNPPKLDIVTPSEGQKFIAEAKDITISGETDPGNRVTINERFVIVAQDGKFNYKTTLSDGDNKFKIVATDIAGNQTIVERKVSYNP